MKEVKITELNAWRMGFKEMFAKCKEAKKRLYCTFRGTFLVYHYGNLVLETESQTKAVEKYNSITAQKQNIANN